MAKNKGAKKHTLDFTKVKERGGNFNKRHQPEGDYRGKVTGVENAVSSSDESDMWLFTIQVGSGTYPLYCKFQENQLWKIRNLWVAAGISVPKKKTTLDPQDVVGKEIAVSLGDEEYNDKMQSTVVATFPLSELEEGEGEPAEDEEVKPEKAKKKKKAKAEPEPEPPAKKNKKGKGKKGKALEELDIEDM